MRFGTNTRKTQLTATTETRAEFEEGVAVHIYSVEPGPVEV